MWSQLAPPPFTFTAPDSPAFALSPASSPSLSTPHSAGLLCTVDLCLPFLAGEGGGFLGSQEEPGFYYLPLLSHSRIYILPQTAKHLSFIRISDFVAAALL